MNLDGRILARTPFFEAFENLYIRLKGFRLQMLRDIAIGGCELLYRIRAVIMYILKNTITFNHTYCYVNSCYVSLLTNLHELDEYAWVELLFANIYTSLVLYQWKQTKACNSCSYPLMVKECFLLKLL